MSSNVLVPHGGISLSLQLIDIFCHAGPKNAGLFTYLTISSPCTVGGQQKGAKGGRGVSEAPAALLGLVGVEDEDPATCLTLVGSSHPVVVPHGLTRVDFHLNVAVGGGEGVPDVTS